MLLKQPSSINQIQNIVYVDFTMNTRERENFIYSLNDYLSLDSLASYQRAQLHVFHRYTNLLIHR